MEIKSGFATIIGRPNVGKSTLLNSIIGQKVSIVTPTSQTTRNKIIGVYHDLETQIVFIDTPGVHKPKHKLGEQLNKAAFSSLKDVELTLFIVDASESIGPGDKYILERLKTNKTPLILVLNKIDLISKNELIQATLNWSEEYNFDEIIPVSALNSENTTTLVEVIKKYLPVGPRYYPEDSVSDNPEHFIISEIIREKIILKTKEEIPHSVAVIIEKMRERKRDLSINATIIVDKKSKKGIIIGKDGKMLKSIGILARRELQNILATKIDLQLFVKIEKNWRNDQKQLKQLGYQE